jgi:hypothetical protein
MAEMKILPLIADAVQASANEFNARLGQLTSEAQVLRYDVDRLRHDVNLLLSMLVESGDPDLKEDNTPRT